MDWKRLREPFAPDDIEWRVGQCGTGTKGIWARVFAYITNRAVMDRLDDVMGPDNWRVEHADSIHYDGEGRAYGHVRCTLSLRINGEWVSKDDAAPLTDFEAVKGGYSDSMKRAAVHFGIGRYLYDLPSGWATICDDGRYYQAADKKRGTPEFRWNPPGLPDWASPSPNGQHASQEQRAKAVAATVPGIKVGAPEQKYSDEFISFFEQVKQTVNEIDPEIRQEKFADINTIKRHLLQVMMAKKIFANATQMVECRDREKFNQAADAWFEYLDRATAFL